MLAVAFIIMNQFLVFETFLVESYIIVVATSTIISGLDYVYISIKKDY